MNESTRGDGLITSLTMETLEDRSTPSSLKFGGWSTFKPSEQWKAVVTQFAAKFQVSGFSWGWGKGGCGGHHKPPVSPPPVSPPPVVTQSVSGVVYDDFNSNGVRDAGEPIEGGRVVWADANDNGVLDAGEVSTTAAADGSYTLTGLPAGTSLVIRSFNLNDTPSPGQSVTLSSGQQMTNVNVGLVLPPS